MLALFLISGRRVFLKSGKTQKNFSFLVVLLGQSSGQEIESTTCQGPGVKYVGTLSTSSSGQHCQDWNSAKGNIGEPHNFCRNPLNASPGVWCYTTNYYVRWEYCEVGLRMMPLGDSDDLL